MAIEQFETFASDYLVKDGMLSNAENINKAPIQLKNEIDLVINNFTDDLTSVQNVVDTEFTNLTTNLESSIQSSRDAIDAEITIIRNNIDNSVSALNTEITNTKNQITSEISTEISNQSTILENKIQVAKDELNAIKLDSADIVTVLNDAIATATSENGDLIATIKNYAVSGVDEDGRYATTQDVSDYVSSGIFADETFQANLSQEISTVISAEGVASSTDLTNLQTIVNDNTAEITNLSQTISGLDFASSTDLTNLSVTVNDNYSEFTQLSETVAGLDFASSTDLTNLASTVNQNTADITNVSSTVATIDSALSTQITELETSVNSNISSINNELYTLTNADFATSSEVNELVSSGIFSDSTFQANLTQEIQTAISAEGLATATQVEALGVTVNDNTAEISNVSSTVATLDTSLSENINTLSTRVGDSEATIQQVDTALSTLELSVAESITTLQASIDENSGSITNFQSTYVTKDSVSSVAGVEVDANGAIAGWKAFSDGTSTAFKITAENFTLTDGTSNYSPFTIQNNTVYATNLKLTGGIDWSEVNNAPATIVKIQYSSNGINWHDSYLSSDIYLRQSTDDGVTWSSAIKFVGTDGTDGVNGTDGTDGTTYYTWVKYADAPTGSGLSDNPTGKEYIGFAYNKTSSVESTNASDYTWSLIKGADGADGADGAPGVRGSFTHNISIRVESSITNVDQLMYYTNAFEPAYGSTCGTSTTFYSNLYDVMERAYLLQYVQNGNPNKEIVTGDTFRVNWYKSDYTPLGQTDVTYVGGYNTFTSAPAFGSTSFIYNNTLYVDGDSIITGTLSVGAFINTSATSDNEVYIQDGKMYATNITADNINADFINVGGDITSGTAGGWNLTTDAIYTGTKTNTGYSTSGMTFSADGSMHSKEFYIDNTGNAFFKGQLSAASGSFSGTITANDGSIGGWDITSSGISTGSTSLNSDGSLTLGNNLTVDTSGDATFSGQLSAATGTFSGGITATTGTIGGWKIDNNNLYSGSSASLSGSYSSSGISINSDGSFISPNFRIDNDGTAHYNGIISFTNVSGTEDLVTNSDLSSTGTTSIDGARITTGIIKNSANTSWFNLDAGTMQLGTGLNWDGSTLSVTGNIEILNAAEVRNDINVSDGANSTTIDTNGKLVTDGTAGEVVTNSKVTLSSDTEGNLIVNNGVITKSENIPNILKGNILESTNYSVGTAGSKINLGDGTFDFGGGSLTYNGTTLAVDGTITANDGSIGGWDITQSGISTTTTSLNNDGSLTLGNNLTVDTNGNATFSGQLSAASGSFSGTITGASGKFTASAGVPAGEIWESNLISSGQQIAIHATGTEVGVVAHTFDGSGISVYGETSTGQAIYGKSTGSGEAGYFWNNGTGNALYAQGMTGYTTFNVESQGAGDINTKAINVSSPYYGIYSFAKIAGHFESYEVAVESKITDTDGGSLFIGKDSTDTTVFNVDYLGNATATTFTPFTGSHRGFVKTSENIQIGDIVQFDEVFKIDINNSIPKISPSITANNKSSFGVYNGHISNSFTAEDVGIKTQDDYIRLSNFLNDNIYNISYFNQVGEGQINVCESNGNIAKGDLITSSNITGKGMKQVDDIIRSYTIAKSLENIDWANEVPGENGCFLFENVKCKTIACFYN